MAQSAHKRNALVVGLLVMFASHYVCSFAIGRRFYVIPDVSDQKWVTLNDGVMTGQGRPLVDNGITMREKRYFCRKFFVYNPVTGRCQPSLMALRKGRSRIRQKW